MLAPHPFVFISDGTVQPCLIDLASLLEPSATITGATLNGTVEPVTTPELEVTSVTVQPGDTSIGFTLEGGVLGTSYGASITVTTTALPITLTLAVLCQVNLNVPYQSGNPYAYQTLIDRMTAGEATVGNALFILPPSVQATGGSITWSLLDNGGAIYSHGNCYDYRVTPSSMSCVIEASSVVNAPTSMPPTMDGQSYQLRWELHLPNDEPVQYAFENITIGSVTQVPLGASDLVELAGDLAIMSIVLPRQFPSVGAEVFYGNNRQIDFSEAQPVSAVASGWLYQTAIDTGPLQPDLVPYLVSWKYRDSPTAPAYRESGRLYVVTPSILVAVEDARQMVMKARTTLYGFHDDLFDVNTIVAWLRRARDLFNAASGLITQFTMVDATDGIREFWLRYAEVAMMRAQYLAEGEKAFDFQGQAVQLSTDKAQYYDQAASNLQQQLDNDVKPFKQNLIKKGSSGGTGNMNGIFGIRGAMGTVGISRNVLSPNHLFGLYSR